MNLVDSCGWLEFLSEGPNASDYAKALTDPAGPQKLLLPSICLQEVFKVVLQREGEEQADRAVAFMQAQAKIVPHDAQLALDAAVQGREHSLALADSIVYATARNFGAKLWTQDSAFEGLPGVHFVKKRKTA